MKLKDLWEKYQHTGINNHPVISDAELEELAEKLEEFQEFLQSYNPAIMGFIMNRQSVQNMIWCRGAKN